MHNAANKICLLCSDLIGAAATLLLLWCAASCSWSAKHFVCMCSKALPEWWHVVVVCIAKHE